jgi:hypothetical protein
MFALVTATRVGDGSGAERVEGSFPRSVPGLLPEGGFGPFEEDEVELEDGAPLTAAATAGVAAGDDSSSLADCGAVRVCLVRALVARASEQARQPFGPDKTCCDYHRRRSRGALTTLGRLACVSRAYREEVMQPWNVDTFLQGLAEPPWRAWARRCRPDNDGANPSPNPPSFNSPSDSSRTGRASSALVRPSLLGTLWRLLQTESGLPRLITRCHEGAAAFNAVEHAPLLRPAAVFLPPPVGRTPRPTNAGLAGSCPHPPRHSSCILILVSRVTGYRVTWRG